MAPKFRRGAAAIAESKQKAESGGGNFKPFAPRIGWSDGDTKYVLFLTPVEEMPTVEMHEYVPIGKWESKDGKRSGTRFGFYISRTDPAIGEDHDILSDEFGMKPKERTLGVAVELEPVTKEVRGRPRPIGFEVKTETFTRKNEDDEEEEVTTPVIGVVSQAASNFFGYLSSFDENQAPVQETAFSVEREGGGTDTSYNFVHYMDQPVDLSGIIDNIDGILYIEDELDELVEGIDGQEELDQAITIADAVLNARLDELADGEKYEEETRKLKKIENPYGSDYVRNADVEDEDDEEEEEEKPARRSRSAKKSTTKAKSTRKAKPKAEEPEEEPEADDEGDEDDADEAGEKTSAKRTKFNEMRKKSARRTAAAK